MRKSNAEAAETRKRILATASNLFLKNGISNTAVADVMAVLGLTIGGFYRHFQSKEQLVAESIGTAFEQLLTFFDTLAAGKSPRAAIDLIVQCYLRQHLEAEAIMLCPMANLSSELRYADDSTKAAITEAYSRFVKMFASYLIRLDYGDYISLAKSIVSVIVGAVSLSRLTAEPELAAAILENAQKTVSLILQNGATSRSLS